VLCATRPCKVCDVCRRLEVTLYALEMLEGMRGVLVCILEVVDDVEGGLCFAGGAGGDPRCAALYTGRAGVPELMRCVLLCMSEAVEGRLRLLEVLGVLECQRVRTACSSVCWRPWRVSSVCRRY